MEPAEVDLQKNDTSHSTEYVFSCVDGGCGKFLVFRVSDIGGSPELLEISLLAKFINNFHPEIFQ